MTLPSLGPTAERLPDSEGRLPPLMIGRRQWLQRVSHALWPALNAPGLVEHIKWGLLRLFSSSTRPAISPSTAQAQHGRQSRSHQSVATHALAHKGADESELAAYSMYGHVNRMAEEIVKGLESSGAKVTRLQFRETLPDDVLAKMHAPAKDANIPTLGAPDTLKEFDGIMFGFPTRFGRAPAQVSTFFDRTGGLWASNGLLGKFAGLFTSTGPSISSSRASLSLTYLAATQHGGQEATMLTTIPWLSHQGMICRSAPSSLPRRELSLVEQTSPSATSRPT